MTEWQPIETAPKDGTDVMLFGKAPKLAGLASFQATNMVPAMAVAQWHEYTFDDYEAAGEGIYRKKANTRGSWRGGASNYSFGLVNPTYWMPLPPLPEAS